MPRLRLMILPGTSNRPKSIGSPLVSKHSGYYTQKSPPKLILNRRELLFDRYCSCIAYRLKTAMTFLSET